MIPKKVFYIWCGDKHPASVDMCVNNWYKTLGEEYQIIEISDTSKKYFDIKKLMESSRWFRTVYQRKMWAFVSDYLRVYVLYNYGGIYLDTDITLEKRLDELLSLKMFAGYESDTLVNAAILGAEEKHPLIKKILDFYEEEIWKSPLYTIPEILTHILTTEGIVTCPYKEDKIIQHPLISVYPPKYFYPYPYGTVFSEKCITPSTYSIHWWSASWVKPEITFFLSNKHKMSVTSLDNIPIKNIKITLCKIPLLSCTVTKYKVFLYRIPFLYLSDKKRKKRSYTLLKTYKLFGLLPILRIFQKTNGTTKKYNFFGILEGKVK